VVRAAPHITHVALQLHAQDLARAIPVGDDTGAGEMRHAPVLNIHSLLRLSCVRDPHVSRGSPEGSFEGSPEDSPGGSPEGSSVKGGWGFLGRLQAGVATVQAAAKREKSAAEPEPEPEPDPTPTLSSAPPVSSQLTSLRDCPICNVTFAPLTTQLDVDTHVNHCLSAFSFD
jgi:hypothetical protein